MLSEKEHIRLTKVSSEVRKKILSIICKAHASHIGSAYSVVEILVYLYEKIIRIDRNKPWDIKRDRLILSKGWGVSALYTVLAHKRVIDGTFEALYCSDESKYVGIATKNGLPGLEATTGSMGHGLPIGVGMSLAAKLRHQKYRVFVILGDGELDEGSTWEAILQAAHFKLDNLVVIVDCNGWQSYGRTRDVLNLAPIRSKFESFGWKGIETDGHNFFQLEKSFRTLPLEKGKPTVIVAKTIKGKGVASFEDKNEWHYKTPGDKEIEIAIKELTN